MQLLLHPAHELSALPCRAIPAVYGVPVSATGGDADTDAQCAVPGGSPDAAKRGVSVGLWGLDVLCSRPAVAAVRAATKEAHEGLLLDGRVYWLCVLGMGSGAWIPVKMLVREFGSFVRRRGLFAGHGVWSFVF